MDGLDIVDAFLIAAASTLGSLLAMSVGSRWWHRVRHRARVRRVAARADEFAVSDAEEDFIIDLRDPPVDDETRRRLRIRLTPPGGGD